MFGRRNPDQPLDAPRQPAQENDPELEMLDDLSNILQTAEQKPEERRAAQPAPEEEPALAPDPAWHAATPSILGPSVTRLLQEAEAAEQQPARPAPATPPAEPATPPATSAAITQQLSAIDAEVLSPAVPALNGEPVAVTAPRVASPGAAPARARAIAESVIGPDDFFDGRYRSERGVRIQGNARGSIESRQYIYVEAGAQVEADLSAEDITVSGDFRGKITCRRRLEVTGSGKIAGEIQTALLVVQEGGAIDGELHMRGQEAAEPNAE
jgi:cytoskeletal protein CcmA (bactofilin family)